jgi:hypothetical protein
LLGQRVNPEYDLGRRGAAASHSAIAVNTPINTPSLTVASLIGIIDSHQTSGISRPSGYPEWKAAGLPVEDSAAT